MEKFPSKAKSLHGKHSHTEVITDLQIMVPGKSHRDILEVKVNGGTKSCVPPLRADRSMFPNNLTADRLPKPDALLSDTHIILESYTYGILPVFGTIILKVEHFRTGKHMLITLFVVDTKNEIIISMWPVPNKG